MGHAAMLIASTMNDWGMNLPGAQRVYWTGSFWSQDRRLAKRLTEEEATLLQARWCATSGKLEIEDDR